MARAIKGRQKIQMTRMSKQSNLLVTFSKRHAGLFKKASELCILCGVEMAIIIFSPRKKKVYSFGQPNMEHIIDKFLTRDKFNPTNDSGVLHSTEPHLVELNSHLVDLHDQLDTQMAYAEILKEARKERQALYWWESSVRELGLEQLQRLKSELLELKTYVLNKRNNLEMIQQSRNLISSSSEEELTDCFDSTLGISFTPQGYAII